MSYPARQTDPTKPYKLRIYVKSGVHKGDLKRQEYFSNLKDLDHRYKELGPNKFADYALNPTAWQLVNGFPSPVGELHFSIPSLQSRHQSGLMVEIAWEKYFWKNK